MKELTRGLLLLGALLLAAGCGGGPPVEMADVRGTVKYRDGSVPTGGVRVVRFEPIEDLSVVKPRKGASGTIQEDGSYRLMTVKPDDGAFLGAYKVVFTIRKTPLGQESLVAAKYTSGKTTPYEVTVESGKENQFDFEIERP